MLLSALVAAGAVVVADSATPAWQVATAAVVAGVFVDLDHFLIARAKDGDWRTVRRLLANPTLPFTSGAALFRDSDLDGLDRLVSHVVLAGLVVPPLLWLAPTLGAVVAASLYVHVLADVYSTARNAVIFDADEVPDGLRDSS